MRALLLATALVLGGSAWAQEAPCPFPGQAPRLIVQLYLGQAIAGRGPVTPREWTRFLADTVTPRLPGGFTVFDAYGQWQGPGQAIGRERTKVILVAAEDSPAFRAGVAEIAAAYRARFKQRLVGILTSTGCGAF